MPKPPRIRPFLAACLFFAPVVRAAETPATLAGFVVVSADTPPLVQVGTRWEPLGAAPVGGFVILSGARVPAWGPGPWKVGGPLAFAAPIVVASARPVRISAAWTWGDGGTSAGEVVPQPQPPRWYQPPWSRAYPFVTHALVRGTRTYRAADEYDVRLEVTLTDEGGARFRADHVMGLPVADPALAVQPWEIALGDFALQAHHGTACSPAPLDGRVEVSLPFTSGSSFDAGHVAVWSWGDGVRSEGVVTETAGRGTVTGHHAYTTGGRWPIELSLTGKRRKGAPRTETKTIEFSTSDFALDDLAPPPDAVAVGEEVAFELGYRAATPGRKLGSYWQWGDGTPDEDGQRTESGGFGTISGRHVYREPGRYTVLAALSDDVCTQTTLAEVVVTAPVRIRAFGSIPSPRGVYLADPKVEGQAALQVDAAFKEGEPTGSVRLSFAAAGLTFESRTLTAVAGRADRADLAGSGTLGGDDGYTFTLLLWRTPAEGPDQTFTWAVLKIQDPSGRPVYDNEAVEGALRPMVSPSFEVAARP